MSPYRDEARTRPDVLVCAGLDPSGGAGILADTRVLHELGARAIGVVTTLTIQNTTGVIGSHAVDAEIVSHQLAFVMTDVEVQAVKIGMIGSGEVARALASTLQLTRAPVVWDPVLSPSRGAPPGDDDWFEEAVAALRPHLTLVTPNAAELARLVDMAVDSPDNAEVAGRALAQRLDCAVLVKGGHIPSSPLGSGDDLYGGAGGGAEAVDVLLHAGGREEFRVPRITGGEHVHGTGCALSSAIAAHLALGRELVEACRLAKHFVAERIADPVRPGRGAPAVV
jgi:hydroxymethylpyrimidine/phosphomethylpyrimidine kinase